MSIEQSLDKLADAILALAAAVSTKQETPAPAGKPAPTPSVATKAAKAETAAGSPSEGKSAAKAEPANTPDTAGVSGASSPKADSSEKKDFDYETEVKPLFLRVVKEKGRDAAVGLIAEYDVTPGKKLNEVVTPAEYGEVIEKIKKLLGEA
jgi:hypothetical protein